MAIRNRQRSLLFFIGLMLLAFALRLYRLDYQSIWWDEGISLHLGTSSIGEIIRDRLDNIHPPLYFFVLKAWLALVGVSPFTGRYLSALASLTQVALVFAAARYWGGQPIIRRSSLPWIAGAFMLLSPLSVIYGQEIRVYAMLPLAYMTALLLTDRLLTSPRLEVRPLFYLALVEWIGLHLHYIALIGVAYIGLWGVVVLARRRDASGLRRWIGTHAAVAAASLPWLLAVLSNWSVVRAEANAGTFTTDPVPLPFLFSQVWAFHLTGLAGSLASRFVQVCAGVSALVVTGLIIYYIVSSERRLQVVSNIPRLALHWLVPLLAGLAVWSVRSFSHPRYIIMFAVMLIPLMAFLIYPARRWATRVAAIALTACLILLSVWGLGRYFFDPNTAKPDMRAVASYLEETAQSGDIIFIPDTDWSFPFEFDGEATILMPSLTESPDDPGSVLNQTLDCAGSNPCVESGRIFVVDYPHGTRDWQGRLPFELERRGHWQSEIAFNDVTVREYRISDRATALPDCDSPDLAKATTRFGALHLVSAWAEQGAAADTAIAVALCWEAIEPTALPYVASIILRDPVTGERITQSDLTLLNNSGGTTENWLPGERVVTYHLLPLPSGTSPVEATLSMGVYTSDHGVTLPLEGQDAQNRPTGQQVTIGDVTFSQPIGQGASPYEVSQPPLWAEAIEIYDGLQLVGARFSPGPYRPGQTIRVGLTWQATGDSLPDVRPALVLVQDEAILVENADAPVNGRFPTDQWRRDQIVFEYRDVRVPAGTQGSAQLAINLDGRHIELGEVTINGSDVIFEPPSAQFAVDVRFDENIVLAGFDTPEEIVTTASNLPLTLYWKSLSEGRQTGYSVFTHLLDETGLLIAQHDSPPANGRRPTDEWLPDEFIIDSHELVWRDHGFVGKARLVVGLYDPATGRRLQTADGTDSYILPITIQVVEEP